MSTQNPQAVERLMEKIDAMEIQDIEKLLERLKELHPEYFE